MRPRPAFFIVCGDLVDAMPDLWPDLRKAQEKDFLKVYSELDDEIPLGNSALKPFTYPLFHIFTELCSSVTCFLSYLQCAFVEITMWETDQPKTRLPIIKPLLAMITFRFGTEVFILLF